MFEGKTIKISFAGSIFAQDGRTVIGSENTIPWLGKVPSDMARFRDLTRTPGENSYIVGRKTFESIPAKFRPFDKNLPLEQSRRGFVVTRNTDFKVDDPRITIVHSLEEAFRAVQTKTVWVIGGSQIYEAALPYTDYLHMTLIRESFRGDAFFPKINPDDWQNILHTDMHPGEPGAESDTIPSTYLVFVRRSP